LVGGHDILSDAKKVREKIGYVQQEISVDEFLTGRENLYLHARINHIPSNLIKSRIDDVLELVELGEKQDHATLTYSGGMRKRLDIANGLLSRPSVLFLDEPTVGLDIQTRRKIWSYIKKIRKEFGMTVFISTHYMEEADELCGRIGIIDFGKIQVIDTPKSMKRAIGNEIISFNLVDGKANQDTLIDQINNIEFVKEVKNKQDSITVFSTNSNEVIPKIFQASTNLNMKINSLTLKQPTLDDVFISYTGHDLRDETENKKYSRRKEFNLNRRKGL
jgi:ABC-2 type transport system ATP-binding protein